MKRLLILCTWFISALVLNGCKYYAYGLEDFFYRENAVENRADKLLSLSGILAPYEMNDENAVETLSGTYEVLIITDVHFGGEDSGSNGSRQDTEFFNWIASVYGTKDSPKTGKNMPKFAICLGDVAEHGLEEEFTDYEKFSASLYETFGIRTFNVIGNHDLYNSGWDDYRKHCYPYTSFYKFRTKNFTWYFLDSASGSLGNSQLTTFKRDMEYNEPGRKKLVFTHIPAYAGGLFYFVMQNTTERNKFISYCAENKTQALIDGHTHKEITSNIGFTEYNLPGYLEKRGFGILTVDEDAQTAYCRCIYYE